MTVAAKGRAGGGSWPGGTVVGGRYRVDAVHEGGGMAVVHRVRHLHWGVDLAVKSPRPELFVTAADREMFEREAQTWVSLPLHPHVCTCHYVSLVDGLPRAFAEYLPGGSLRDWIADRRLYRGGRVQALARVLDVAVQVAWGLHHAHENALVHQDVKAANVLLDTPDPAAAFTAKVTDFGLAKARPGSAEVLQAMAAAGTVLTPRGGMTATHASPEQFAGELLTRRTDVWSFAVTVLEMLAGGVRWQVGLAAPAVLAELVAHGPDPGLPALPEALSDLLGRCLQADPGRRPRSTASLAADLAAVKQDVDHRAPRPAPRSLAGGAVELNNRALSLIDLGRLDEAGAAFDAALRADPRHLETIYNAGLLRWRRAEQPDEHLVTALQDAGAEQGDPPLARYLLAEVHRERGDGDAARALAGTLGAVEPDVPDLAEWPDRIRRSGFSPGRSVAEVEVNWQVHLPPGLPVQHREHRAVAICLSADGRTALTGDYGGLVASWDLATGERVAALEGHERRVLDVHLSADGTRAVSVSSDQTVRHWDLPTGTCRASWPITPFYPQGLAVTRARLLPDGDTAALVLPGAGVHLFDLRTGGTLAQLAGTADERVVEPGASGRYLLSGTGLQGSPQDGLVRIWDVRDGRLVQGLTGQGRVVSALLLREDHGDVFAAVSGTVLRWDRATGRLLGEFRGHPTEVTSLAAFPDGQVLASGGMDGTVRLWDVATGRCLRTYRHRGQVSAVRVGPHGEWVACAGQRNLAQRWSVATPYTAAWRLARIRSTDDVGRASGRVADLARRATAAEHDGDVGTAVDLLRQARSVPGHERDAALRAAWRRLARACRRPGVRSAWRRHVLTGHSGYVRRVALSADGTVGISGGGRAIEVWDVAAGRRRSSLEGHPRPVNQVSMSRDGRRAVSADDDGELRYWDLDAGTCRTTVPPLVLRHNYPEKVRKAFLVPFAGPARAVVGYFDATVRVWDLDEGTLLGDTGRCGGSLDALAINADATVMLAQADRRLHVYDLYEGRWTHSFGELSYATRDCLVLSPDGRLAALSHDRKDPVVRIWDVAEGRLVHTLGPLAAGALQFTPDGRYLLAGGGPRSELTIWEIATGACLRAVPTGGLPWDLAVSDDGFTVLVTSSGSEVEVYEVDWDLAP